MTIHTARLDLVPCQPAHIMLLRTAPERFAEHAGFPALPGLADMHNSPDVSPEWIATLEGATGADPWRFGFFLVERAQGCAIGSAGFTGPPNAAGEVEIAYGLVAEREGQGFATEAARALIDFALADPRVMRLCAHTLTEPNASTRVLTKCGFAFAGEETVPHDGLVWRWERAR